MKKILFVLRPVAGGMAEHIRILVQGLEPDWQVVIAGPAHLQIEREGVVHLPLAISASLSPVADWPAIRQLRHYLQANYFDLVHAHGAKAALVSRLAALGLKVPVVMTAHNLVLSGSVGGWKALAYQVLEHWLAARTAGYIAVSSAIAAELEYLGAKPTRVRVIYNGIDVDSFSRFHLDKKQARWELGLGQEGRIVGTVARFAPQKGLRYFVEMAEMLLRERDGLRFLLVGDGPLRSQLEEMVSSKGLASHFVFAGHVADIRPYLKAMDVFVLPSLSEGLGISLLEAIAAGLPVVATRTGGIPEVINDGQEGWLVPPADSLALAGKVAWVLDNPEQVLPVVQQARTKVSAVFSHHAMLEQTQLFYDKIISEGKEN